MKVATSCEPILLEPGVAEFLERHAAEAEFQTASELVRTCFPQVRSIRAYLQEDPDENDRRRVVFHALVPQSHPLDLLEDQQRHFYEQLVERCPPARFPDPVCGLIIGFAEE
jgi:hypothetical protein